MKLIGYCSEDGHRLLVSEFFPKGSLDNHLFRGELLISFHYCHSRFLYYFHFRFLYGVTLFSTLEIQTCLMSIVFGIGIAQSEPLSWQTRMKIALGVAKALAFLHSDEVNVMHRSLRSSGILLDSVCNYI